MVNSRAVFKAMTRVTIMEQQLKRLKAFTVPDDQFVRDALAKRLIPKTIYNVADPEDNDFYYLIAEFESGMLTLLFGVEFEDGTSASFLGDLYNITVEGIVSDFARVAVDVMTTQPKTTTH